MLKEKNELLEMARLKFSVHAVEGMRYCVGNLSRLQVALQLKDIVAHTFDVAVLLFRDSPNKDVHLARFMGEIRRDLFAEKGARQVRNLQATIDCIVVSDGDVIHSALEQLPVQRLWVRIAVGKIKAAEEPFFRSRTVARVNM